MVETGFVSSCFLLRLSIIQGFRPDCPRSFLLRAKIAVHEKWLPAETVCVILLPAESLSRKQIHADSLGRKPFFVHSSFQEAKDPEQSRLKPGMTDSLGRRGKLAD